MMPWPWSTITRKDEDLRRKDYDVAVVKREVTELVVELKTAINQFERKLAKEKR